MKVTLTRDCIIGPQQTPGVLNHGKAGQTVNVTDQNGVLLITTGSAVKADDKPPK